MKSTLFFLAFLFATSTAIAQEPVAIYQPIEAEKEVHAAGLFIEPSLTYERSDSTVNYPAPFANSSGVVDGFGIGARLAFHLNEVFFLGLDGRYSMPEFKDSAYKAKAVSANWALLREFKCPISVYGYGVE